MNMLGALAKVGSLTMVSRVLGFVRDTVIARAFGAGMATDAFFVAFKLPNLLRRVFAEGAFAQAFVPILAEYKETRSKEATEAFIRHVAGMLSFVLVIVTALGILAAPWVIYVSAPGFAKDADKFQLSIDLLRITFPYILLISLSSFVGSVLNSYHKFSIPAFTPTFLNVSFIVFALFFVPYFDPPVTALAWAVFVGGILQLGFQLPWLAKLGFLKLPKLNFKDAAVNRVMKQMAPAILGVSVAQTSLVINTIFASYLQSGSVSWMYYADRMMELPSGVLGAALGTILLPTLSKHSANQDTEQFSALLDWGLRLCLLLILPAAVGLAVLGFPLVATLFMYRQFSVHDAQMTHYALLAYSVGLPAMILPRILASGFYAQKNVKTPTKIALISLACTQLFNLILVWNLKHIGLALATALGAWVNALLLLSMLRIRELYTPRAGWRRYLFRIGIALCVMAGGLYAAQSFFPVDWGSLRGYHRAGILAAFIGLAVLLYFATLHLLGWRVRELKRVEQK